MFSNEMYELGAHSSVIREIFEYAKKRAEVVGRENIFDFSIGNPSVPAPENLNDIFKKLLDTMDPLSLHGYS